MALDTSQWRHSSIYDFVEGLVAPDLAWEWLRRNAEYQRDYAAFKLPTTDFQQLTALVRKRWGLQFRCSPTSNATEATIYWAPEADPHTIILTAEAELPWLNGAAQTEFHRDSTRHGIDGVSMLLGKGTSAIRALLLGDAQHGGQLVALIPLGTDGLDRIEATTRFWQAVNRGKITSDPRLTLQQRRRLRHMLQAIDGRANGATYREIADVIYGTSRVAADHWKTSALRDSTIDLVKDGLALIAGGYRKLLRHRRRS